MPKGLFLQKSISLIVGFSILARELGWILYFIALNAHASYTDFMQNVQKEKKKKNKIN